MSARLSIPDGSLDTKSAWIPHHEASIVGRAEPEAGALLLDHLAPHSHQF